MDMAYLLFNLRLSLDGCFCGMQKGFMLETFAEI